MVMIKEKPKLDKESSRDIESRHFESGPYGEINLEIFRINQGAFDMAKELLLMREAELIMDTDSNGSERALVKNKKGEIVFATDLSSEIEELGEVAHNMLH